MADIARFALRHAASGYGVATLFVAGLLLTDPGGIATVLRHPAEGPWPVVLLWFFSGLTFGAAQIGGALMLLDMPGRRDRR